MTALQTAFARLYQSPPVLATADHPAAAVRALVLELGCPASWALLSLVWCGVQADLELPAPGIAVNGRDGLQLWFSLRDGVSRERALAWLEGLRRRYLPEVPLQRVRLLCGVTPLAVDAAAGAGAGEEARGLAPAVPVKQAANAEGEDRWSAFIAQDLAPIFEDTPWLDMPPGDDGQTQLLNRLSSVSEALWAASEVALGVLTPTTQAPLLVAAAASPPLKVAGDATLGDPHAFLRAVMNDATQPMALRMDAAKALLPYSSGVAPSC